MDYLKAVFWDYPKFTDAEKIRSLLRREGNDRFYLWAMRRFLEYGRADHLYRDPHEEEVRFSCTTVT